MTRKKKIIILALLVIVILPVGITFSRYVETFIKYYLTKANDFYFNSDKLTKDGETYSLNNWGGVGEFSIQFQLNNHKNNLLTSESDISYNVEVECSNDLSCTLSAESGVIYKNELTDNLTIYANPQRPFATGEQAVVTVKATSTSPYTKTLSATFTMTVGKKGVNHEIEDERNRAYLNYLITNALEEYTVLEAFSTYSVGDLISSTTYLALDDASKSKCSSARITLTFDPRNVIVDSTSEIVKYATTTSTIIGGIDYINSLTFDVEALSSNIIRFYKIDPTQDYTNDFLIISHS